MSPALFTFADLVTRVCPEFQGAGRWKVVRHKDGREEVPDLVELFHLDREALEFYQADQGKDVFKCEGIFSFLGLPGRRALFIGGYFVRGSKQVLPPDPAKVHVSLRPLFERVAVEDQGKLHYEYSLERDPRFSSLEMRAVIDWGAGDRSWHQWDLDKPVVELREPDSLGPCSAFHEIDVSLAKLAFIAQHEEANPSWRERLSAIGGIYLLTDHANQRLYVGQAGGEGGLWSRWLCYAGQRTGNVAIDAAFACGDLRPEMATLSVLEVVPLRAASKPHLDSLEVRWKKRLCSREGGYNRN